LNVFDYIAVSPNVERDGPKAQPVQNGSSTLCVLKVLAMTISRRLFVLVAAGGGSD